MSRTNVRTNKADFMGSVLYNINRMTGYALGVGPDDHYLYSDGISDSGILKDYITMDVVDEKGVDIKSSISYGHTTYAKVFGAEDYYAGDWFLFGQSWLPWFAPPPKPDATGWYRRRDYEDNTVFNKASQEVLIPTALTVAKLTGITLGSYYGLKYTYRLASRRGFV